MHVASLRLTYQQGVSGSRVELQTGTAEVAIATGAVPVCEAALLGKARSLSLALSLRVTITLTQPENEAIKIGGPSRYNYTVPIERSPHPPVNKRVLFFYFFI